MVVRWQQRLAAAERATNGPGLLEQILDALGVTWRPHPRRLLAALVLLTAIALVLVIVIIVAIVVFWPQLEPIVRLFTGNENGG